MSISTLLLFQACQPGSGAVLGTPDTLATLVDGDLDGIDDEADNCPADANPDQSDLDQNGIGDACDGPPDLDADSVPDHLDNCANLTNPDQRDEDGDGIGDACDNCVSAINVDQADANGDGIGDACLCDACTDQWCITHPDSGVSCAETCGPNREGPGGVCCPLGSRWDNGSAQCKLPDLTVDAATLSSSAVVGIEDIADDGCAVTEGCVDATGLRTLLRFTTTTINDGAGDLYLGTPSEDNGFVYSECHLHDHFDGYADYTLVDASGSIVAAGHKQGFCLIDTERWTDDAGLPKYDNCANQGITRGYADSYSSDLECQLIDVTSVAAGTYLLRVEVNPDRLLAEGDYTNNVVEVEVVIP